MKLNIKNALETINNNFQGPGLRTQKYCGVNITLIEHMTCQLFVDIVMTAAFSHKFLIQL